MQLWPFTASWPRLGQVRKRDEVDASVVGLGQRIVVAQHQIDRREWHLDADHRLAQAVAQPMGVEG